MHARATSRPRLLARATTEASEVEVYFQSVSISSQTGAGRANPGAPGSTTARRALERRDVYAVSLITTRSGAFALASSTRPPKARTRDSAPPLLLIHRQPSIAASSFLHFPANFAAMTCGGGGDFTSVPVIDSLIGGTISGIANPVMFARGGGAGARDRQRGDGRAGDQRAQGRVTSATRGGEGARARTDAADEATPHHHRLALHHSVEPAHGGGCEGAWRAPFVLVRANRADDLRRRVVRPSTRL